MDFIIADHLNYQQLFITISNPRRTCDLIPKNHHQKFLMRIIYVCEFFFLQEKI